MSKGVKKNAQKNKRDLALLKKRSTGLAEEGGTGRGASEERQTGRWLSMVAILLLPSV